MSITSTHTIAMGNGCSQQRVTFSQQKKPNYKSGNSC